MQRVGGRDATGAPRVAADLHGVAAAVVLSLAAAGCAATSPMPGSLVDSRGGPIAIESVEGAPAPVVRRFVRDLNEAAAARQVAVVSRGGTAVYRIRGYLAAHPEPNATSIAWAWDVYDADQRRVFRLNGEERSSAARQSWAADEPVLRRIARASVEQLAVFLAAPRTPRGSGPEVAPAVPERTPSLVARLDDFRPEAAGIFRVLRTESAPVQAETTAADGPLPRHRPRPSGTTAAALAYTTAER